MTELDTPNQEHLAKWLTERFDYWDTQKSAVRARWREAERTITGMASKAKRDRFYGLVPFGKQTVQVILSHFWSRSLATDDILFDVQGEDQQSQEMAPLHKRQHAKHCQKDRLAEKLDDTLLLHALPKGVAVGCVDYTVTEEMRRMPVGIDAKWQGATGEPMLDGETHQLQGYKTFEGSTYKMINPHDFVFDMDNHSDWDSCFKGFRVWMQYEDIAADPNFHNYEALFDKVVDAQKKKPTRQRQHRKHNKKDKGEKGIDDQGMIEVRQYHGDFRLKDGTLLRNWFIVVAANEYIIRFGENPYMINPFKKWCYEETEDGWGISPIVHILGLIDAASIHMSTGVEVGKLAMNPPWITPKGALSQKKTYLTEGQHIEYDPNEYNSNLRPEPYQPNYQVPFPFVQYFEGQAEATTGATRQLSGNVTTNDKEQTATEFQGLQVVGNMIIDRVVDQFNRRFKIPIISDMAKLNAYFNPEPMNIAIENDKGIREFKEVGQEVYFGNYEYTIVDNRAELERKQNIKEKLSFYQQLRQDPEVGPRMKAVDAAKEIFTDLGYGTPAKLFMDDQEFEQEQIKNALLAHKVQMAVMLHMQQMDPTGVVRNEQLRQQSEEAAVKGSGAPASPTGA